MFSFRPSALFLFLIFTTQVLSGNPTGGLEVTKEQSGVHLLAVKESHLLQLAEFPLEPAPIPEPAQELKINLSANLRWEATEGLLKYESPTQVRWFPLDATGIQHISVHRHLPDTTVETRSLRVILPAEFNPAGDGSLGGTMIGIYPVPNQKAPAPVARNPQAYAAPTSFYPVNEQTARVPLQGGFTLEALSPAPLPDQQGTRYVALHSEALGFLNALEAALDSDRGTTEGLRILRGYISPHERLRMETLGIKLAEFTRFQYGDAFALIWDSNADFRMDDLNKDGKIDVEDSAVLAETVKKVFREQSLQGGIGLCARFEGPDHLGTPYLHVDLRGWMVEWREE
jgi:hypothetical protein